MPTASSASISVSAQAYAKIVLHSAKYPASTVRGLLIGRAGAAAAAAAAQVDVDVLDIIPLVHHWTDLAPATEIGCALAQAHLASPSSTCAGASIVGLYEAPALMGVREPSRAGVKLARKIASLPFEGGSGGAVVLVVNNSLLLSPSSGHALLPFHLPPSSSSAAAQLPEPSSLPSSSTKLASEAATIAAVAEMVQRGLAEQFVDFDDHLADTRKDWLANSVPLAV